MKLGKCPNCGKQLYLSPCDCGYDHHYLNPDNPTTLLPDDPRAYDCSKMSIDELFAVKAHIPDKKGWNNYDYAEHAAYREAVNIEIEKRNEDVESDT